VERSVPSSRGGGAPIVRDRTKSGKPRTVPLADIIIPLVRRRCEGKDPDELVFTAPEGGWLNSSNWRRGVRWTKTSRGRRPHDLRHPAATSWLAVGVDVKTVQTWLGHASAELTLNLYGHHLGTDADRTGIARVNAMLGDATGTRAAPVSGDRRAVAQKSRLTCMFLRAREGN
jgi:integrase